GTHEPLVGARAEGIAAEVTEVQVEVAPHLGAIHMAVNSALVRQGAKLFRGHPEPSCIGYVGDREDLRFGSERRLEELHDLAAVSGVRRNGYSLHREPVASGAHVPCVVVARMILLPEHHLVPSSERNAVIDHRVRLAGITYQRDFIRRYAKLIG